MSGIDEMNERKRKREKDWLVWWQRRPAENGRNAEREKRRETERNGEKRRETERNGGEKKGEMKLKQKSEREREREREREKF